MVRAAVLVPAFALGLWGMRDLGFRGRPLRLATFGSETRRIARAGITYGLRDRVVRYVMFASLVQGIFLMYGFYSWQKYFLDLLGRDLVWVTGVIAGLVGLTQIAGNAVVGRVGRRVPDRGTVLIATVVVSSVVVVGAALIQSFWVAVPLYLVSAFAWGLYIPIKQGWINDRIPSSERATIISLDALFGDAGNTAGQLGLGYLSTAVSIPFAWLDRRRRAGRRRAAAGGGPAARAGGSLGGGDLRGGGGRGRRAGRHRGRSGRLPRSARSRPVPPSAASGTTAPRCRPTKRVAPVSPRPRPGGLERTGESAA